MKKIITVVLCALLICSLIASCEKDDKPDTEIKYEQESTTKPQNAQTDDPNNGFGDIITPKN